MGVMHGGSAALFEHLTELRLRGLAATTIDSRRLAIRRLARLLGKDPLTATRDDLDAWQKGLVLTVKGRAFEVTNAREYFKWAKRTGWTEDDPSDVLIVPKLPRRLPRPISEEDLEVAMASAPRDLRAQLVLAAYEGLRACELAGLVRDDVLDTADPPVLRIRGKGDKVRIVPLGPLALQELRAYGMPRVGPVFPRMDGQPGHQSPNRVSQRANRFLHGLGITHTLHSCRHRFGTRLYAVTADLRMVQEVMGHTDPATTAGYVAYSRRAAVDAIDAMQGVESHHRRASDQPA